MNAYGRPGHDVMPGSDLAPALAGIEHGWHQSPCIVHLNSVQHYVLPDQGFFQIPLIGHLRAQDPRQDRRIVRVDRPIVLPHQIDGLSLLCCSAHACPIDVQIIFARPCAAACMIVAKVSAAAARPVLSDARATVAAIRSSASPAAVNSSTKPKKPWIMPS